MGRLTLSGKFVVPGAIFAGALAVRLVGVDFGLPYAYNWDEPYIAIPVLRFWMEGDWLPHFYNYPAGYIYLHFLTAPLSYFLAVIRDGGAPSKLTFTDFYLVGRLTTVAFGVTAIGLVYSFARRLTGDRWAGAFAAAFLAVLPLHVAGSRYMTTDVPMAATAFAAAFVFAIYLGRRDLPTLLSAAVLFGAAAGIKYNAAFFAVPAAAFVALGERSWLRAALFIGTVAGGFLLLNPGVVLEHTVFLRDVFYDSRQYFSTGDATGATLFQWPRFFAHLWSYALTPGPLLLAAAGTALLVWRERRQAVYFLMFPLSYAVFLAVIRVTHVRTLQPVLPYAAVLAGVAAAAGARALRRRFGPLATGAAVALLCGAVFFRPAFITARETAALLGGDDRTLAKEWFESRVPWPQRVAKESGNWAPLSRGGQLDGPPLDEDKYEVHVGPYIVADDAAAYAAAGFTYLVALNLNESLDRAVSADPARADLYRRNYSSLVAHASPVLVLRPRKYAAPFGVQIFRLDDETLRRSRPPLRGVRFDGGWVRSEEAPFRKMPRVEGRFVLEAPARAGACFTAPAERFRVTAVAERLAGEPRLVLEVDGVEVAAEELRGTAAVATSPLAAPPYFRHLAVRCLGPPGSRARLKSAVVEEAR
jgi:4-amino-4-deoxy-L-arabinose transferase-like glycosyltransferase